MPKQEVPFEQLIPFIPEGSFDDVLHYIRHYKVQLTITRQRETILGDYRHKHGTKGHRISVNGSLNKFSFLVTLLHELAHLFTFEKYGRVAPHGKEWKTEFGVILSQFLSKKIFPEEIEAILLKSLSNPAASSCADERLLRALKKYDHPKTGMCFVEQIEENSLFSIKGGRTFRRGTKQRTRYKCKEIATGKWFLFSGVYEVTRMS